MSTEGVWDSALQVADRVAVRSSDGLDKLVKEILSVLEK